MYLGYKLHSRTVNLPSIHARNRYIISSFLRRLKGQTHLDTKSVTSVFGGTVLSLISEPVVWFHRNSFPFVTINQFLQITNPHTSTNNLSNTRNKDINTFSVVGVILQTGHVERFKVFGEMNKHNGSVDLVGHLPLGSLGDIVTVDVGCTVFFVDTVFGEVLDGVSVVESHEWSLWRDKVGVEGLDNLSCDRVGKEVVDDIANDALEVIKQVFEGDENEFGFEMGVLGQMSTLSATLVPLDWRLTVSSNSSRLGNSLEYNRHLPNLAT